VVEEEERVEGLVLGGRADVAVDGERREKRGDVRLRERGGVSHAAPGDEAADPGGVGVFGAAAEVAKPAGAANLVEEPGSACGRGGRRLP
jgi:hypothetical protein